MTENSLLEFVLQQPPEDLIRCIAVSTEYQTGLPTKLAPTTKRVTAQKHWPDAEGILTLVEFNSGFKVPAPPVSRL